MGDSERERKLEQILIQLNEDYGRPQVEKEGALKTLIRTILSQNTNDDNRDKAMDNLMEDYDRFSQLIATPRDKLKEVIAVAGLNNRKSKAIKIALKQIKQERGSLDPKLSFLGEMDVKKGERWLRKLYGVGPKTARIVLLFEFDKPVFPVDTHCARVLKRGGYAPDKLTAEKIGNRVREDLEVENLIELHLNLIKHGRQVCKAQGPLCRQCSLLELCDFGQNKVEDA